MAVGLLRPDAGRGLGARPRRVGRSGRGQAAASACCPTACACSTGSPAPSCWPTHGLLRGMDPAVVDQRARELLDVLALGRRRPHAGRRLLGRHEEEDRRWPARCCTRPRLLVLDEPFEAVDPVSAALIRDILQRYVAGGGTVIFSSHVMEVVERLCIARRDPGRRARSSAVGTLAEVRGEPRPGGRVRRGGRRPHRDRRGAGVAVTATPAPTRSGRSPPGTSSGSSCG